MTTNKKTVQTAVERTASCAEAFSGASAERRAWLLSDMADRVDALGERLTETASRETHLPAARLQGERGRTVGQLRMFSEVVREGSWVDARIDRAQPGKTPAPRPDLRRMLHPIGPVAVFGASNFPLAFSVAGGDTASALAAGCPVVCKAHPHHPETSNLVAGALCDAVAAAGFPDGLFTLLRTESNEENVELVSSPEIAAVGFTGSHRAGRALFDAANRRSTPIPVFAEMASVNPVVMLPGALRERGEELAVGLHKSFTMGVGQFCTKPNVVFALAGASTEALIERLAKLADATAPEPMLHGGIARGYSETLKRLQSFEGVETVVAVASTDEGTGGVALLRCSAADALRNVDLLEECFGPSTLIVVADNLEQCQTVLSRMPGQLTATIHMADTDSASAEQLLPLFRRLAGRVLFNGFPTGVEVCASMQHGGPYPATTDSRFTSVGTAAILRWVRPVCYQATPPELLPPELQNSNPREIWRTVDGRLTKDAL